jgi:hypothetical protein
MVCRGAGVQGRGGSGRSLTPFVSNAVETIRSKWPLSLTFFRSFTIVARLKEDTGEIVWISLRTNKTTAAQRLLTRKSDS